MTNKFKRGDTVKFYLNKNIHFGKIDEIGQYYYIVACNRDYPFSQSYPHSANILLKEYEIELKDRQNHPHTTIFK